VLAYKSLRWFPRYSNANSDTNNRSNIKSANALTRQLNPFKSLLHLEYDICYLMERSGKERTLHLTRISNDGSDDTVRPSTDTVTTVIK
jgi:hypothetical protein